jgi:hypothetical protein
MGKRKKRSKSKKPQAIQQARPKIESKKHELPKPRFQSTKPNSIQKDIDAVLLSSQRRESTLTTVESLIFFSTKTGDAWILNTDKGFAKCLRRDGEKQPITINDVAPYPGIDWDAEYHIKGRMFIVMEFSGASCSIIGYPTDLIEETTRRMGK